SDYGTSFPLEPFHGTIGVAPAAFEARNVLVPEAFGGNMDTPEAKAGATIYLGVNVAGGLFSLGDGHYTMGEGETCGVAVEGAMNTVLTVEVVKGVFAEWPRLESDDAIMVAGSYRPLEDAFRIAHTQLVNWIAKHTGPSDMAELADARPGAYRLENADSNWPPPAAAVKATRDAVGQDRYNSYLPLHGLPELRKAIADRYQADLGLRYDPDGEVVVTSATGEAMLDVLLS